MQSTSLATRHALTRDKQVPSVAQDTPPVGADASPKGGEKPQNAPQGDVGEGRHSHCGDLTLLSRVHRIQREIEACRPVSDADLLQHAHDLTALMEQAWNAYEATRNEFALQHARKRLTQRDAARRLLSAEWQLGREAQILAACSAGFFIDQGDKDRAQIAANEGKAG